MARRSVIQKPVPGSLPEFDRTLWDRPDVLASTNCYAFAADRPLGHPGTFGPQPGDRHFRYLREISRNEVSEKAEIDGFIPAGNNPVQREGHYLVALAISRNHDYHWYRQMPDGTWWHKPAPGKPVTNLDYDGKVITDPRTANRRNKRYEYKHFGGFFHVPVSGLDVGVTPDRQVLREFEMQEVLELVKCQKERRTRVNTGRVERDNLAIREIKAEIAEDKPKTAIGAAFKRLGQQLDDAYRKLTGQRLAPRPDPAARLEAFKNGLVDRGRQEERQLRRRELCEIRELIESQQERAESGFRATPAMLRYKIEKQKGQRHPFSVAADVIDGVMRWTPLTIDREPVAGKAMPHPASRRSDPERLPGGRELALQEVDCRPAPAASGATARPARQP
jgi:hypothetical protein